MLSPTLPDGFKFYAPTHRYSLNGADVPSVSSIIEPLTSHVYGCINRDTLRAAADFGIAIHACTELVDEEDLDWETLDPEWTPYVMAWEKFVVDMKPVFLASEMKLYSPLGFAGTLDRIVEINGEQWIIDIKTTCEIHAHVGVQLAGYEILTNACFKEFKQLKRAAVQLRGDGTFRFKEFSSKSDTTAFLSLLNIKNWRFKNGY